MDDIEQLRAELALAKAFGLSLYHRAFPTKSAPIVVPTARDGRTAREACGGREPSLRWREVPVTGIDVETTGTDPTTDRVVEIAFVHSDGRELGLLVNPGVPIPPGATAIHGIDDAAVAHAPTFAEAWAEAKSQGFLDAHPLAYQAQFDLSMVVAELARAGLAEDAQRLADVEWLDAFVAIKDVDKFAKGKKLVDACARRGIVIEGAHRALADARATLALWRKLEGWADAQTERGALAELLRATKARRLAQDADFAAWQAREQAKSKGRAA